MEMTAEREFDYYTKVINEAMEGLMPAERGVYQYMRAQNPDPSKWQFNLEAMARELNVSYYQIRKLVKQLISKGLVERIQQRVHGFIKYCYKVRNKKGEIRDDVNLVKRKANEVSEVKSLPVVEVKKEPKVEEKKIEKKEWHELFKGNERFIEKFIADRKRHLSNCDHYKKLGRGATEIETENHISRKLNETNGGMEARIKEFIATELGKEKLKEEVNKENEITEAKRLEIEMKNLISNEKIALSKKLLPDFWGNRENGNFSFMSLKEKNEAENSIREELEAIETKYQEIYKPLIEKAKNEQ